MFCAGFATPNVAIDGIAINYVAQLLTVNISNNQVRAGPLGLIYNALHKTY
jgi:hypothetical protein